MEVYSGLSTRSSNSSIRDALYSGLGEGRPSSFPSAGVVEYTCESGHRRGARWGFDAGVHVYMSCVCVYPLLDDVVDSLLEDAAEGLEGGSLANGVNAAA